MDFAGPKESCTFLNVSTLLQFSVNLKRGHSKTQIYCGKMEVWLHQDPWGTREGPMWGQTVPRAVLRTLCAAAQGHLVALRWANTARASLFELDPHNVLLVCVLGPGMNADETREFFSSDTIRYTVLHKCIWIALVVTSKVWDLGPGRSSFPLGAFNTGRGPRCSRKSCICCDGAPC